MNEKYNPFVTLSVAVLLMVGAPSSQAFYNPETGRWLNRDPIEEKGGPNWYSATSNDPLNACDPFGLYVFTGTTVFNGKGNASPIGGFLYGTTIVIKDFHFAAHVEGKDDCSCCVDSVDVILGIYEFVPIVGDDFRIAMAHLPQPLVLSGV